MKLTPKAVFLMAKTYGEEMKEQAILMAKLHGVDVKESSEDEKVSFKDFETKHPAKSGQVTEEKFGRRSR